jgi:hypothetical protein
LWKWRKRKERGLIGEKPKATETVLTDQLARGVVKDVDEHVLVGMAGEKARKNFDEVFFILEISLLETFANVEPMRPLGAI